MTYATVNDLEMAKPFRGAFVILFRVRGTLSEKKSLDWWLQ